MAFGFGNEAEVTGEVEADRFAAAARGQAGVAEDFPAGGDEIGLFGEFALRRVEGVLAGNVEQSGGHLPQAGAHGMTVLLDEEDLLLLVHTGHGHGTGVGHEVADEPFGLRQVEGVADDVPHGTPVDHLGVGDLRRIRLVVQLAHSAHCLFRAAATRPAKSGCGRVGRDLSSG